MDNDAPTPLLPRLRILPVYCARDGEPSHYLILDRLGPTDREQAENLSQALSPGVPVLAFTDEIDLPGVDAGGDDDGPV